MPFIRGRSVQSAADTIQSDLLALPDLDGKSGYSFKAIEVWWENGETVAPADYEVRISIQTVNSAVNPLSDDRWLVGDGWAQQNTAGAAVTLNLKQHKIFELPESRLTVQPDLYAVCFSTSTGISNIVSWTAYYDLIKLTELEYLRLLAAGA